MKQHYLGPLFDPKSILVYTRPEDESSPGRLLEQALKKSGYQGVVKHVESNWHGFAPVQLPSRPDLALIAVGDKHALDAFMHAALLLAFDPPWRARQNRPEPDHGARVCNCPRASRLDSSRLACGVTGTRESAARK